MSILILLALQHVQRCLIYQDSPKLISELFVINFIFLVLAMFVIDLIVTKVGMALADRQVLLSGSTQLLDNLEERLVILDQ